MAAFLIKKAARVICMTHVCVQVILVPQAPLCSECCLCSRSVQWDLRPLYSTSCEDSLAFFCSSLLMMTKFYLQYPVLGTLLADSSKEKINTCLQLLFLIGMRNPVWKDCLPHPFECHRATSLSLLHATVITTR